jgi:hypothetical protein
MAADGSWLAWTSPPRMASLDHQGADDPPSGTIAK